MGMGTGCGSPLDEIKDAYLVCNELLGGQLETTPSLSNWVILGEWAG